MSYFSRAQFNEFVHGLRYDSFPEIPYHGLCGNSFYLEVDGHVVVFHRLDMNDLIELSFASDKYLEYMRRGDMDVPERYNPLASNGLEYGYRLYMKRNGRYKSERKKLNKRRRAFISRVNRWIDRAIKAYESGSHVPQVQYDLYE